MLVGGESCNVSQRRELSRGGGGESWNVRRRRELECQEEGRAGMSGGGESCQEEEEERAVRRRRRRELECQEEERAGMSGGGESWNVRRKRELECQEEERDGMLGGGESCHVRRRRELLGGGESCHSLTLRPKQRRGDEPLVLNIDERQRLARERREEREKQTAARESAWQEREERARQHYEKHLEERRRKLEEQRMKEDKRRSAARHEAVMRRTVERSQRARHKPNRWSWGGALPGNTPTTPGGFVESSFLYPLDLAGLEHHLQGAFSVYRRYGLSHQCMRRMPLTPWENTVVSRLLQPTHSYLARSRSAMSLSGDTVAMPVCPRSVSCHPMGSMSFKSIQSQPLTVCRSQEPRRLRDNTNRRRTTGNAQKLSLPPPHPSRPPQKPSPRPPTPKQLRSPSGEDVGNLRPKYVGSPPAHKPTAGTTDPEEATRILAEKRRQAREQREREEERRGKQEEAERCGQEEMAQRKAEERQRREEEEERAQQERDEERAQQERDEEERAQQERDEERAQQERDEEERAQQKQVRQMRLEEIMKRTRRSGPAEKKTTPHKNVDESASSCDSPGPL
ncbi:unnamed protein product, partial [Coregonus sp. 'balchen']